MYAVIIPALAHMPTSSHRRKNYCRYFHGMVERNEYAIQREMQTDWYGSVIGAVSICSILQGDSLTRVRYLRPHPTNIDVRLATSEEQESNVPRQPSHSDETGGRLRLDIFPTMCQSCSRAHGRPRAGTWPDELCRSGRFVG